MVRLVPIGLIPVQVGARAEQAVASPALVGAGVLDGHHRSDLCAFALREMLVRTLGRLSRRAGRLELPRVHRLELAAAAAYPRPATVTGVVPFGLGILGLAAVAVLERQGGR